MERPEVEPECKKAAIPQTVQELKSKVFAANHKGFSPGLCVSCKIKTGENANYKGVYQIEEIGEEICKLVSKCVGKPMPDVTIPTDKLMNEWKIVHEKVATKIEGWTMPWETKDQRWQLDGTRAQALYNHVHVW